MKRYAIGLMAILLCIGQNCLSSIDTGTGNDGGDDNGGNNGGTTPAVKGIPEGFYSGTMTIEQSMDNLSDAYPAETASDSKTVSERFDENGKLLRPDGKPWAVGDVFYSSTGDFSETITSVTVGTNYYEYQTTAEMVMGGPAAGLSWQFQGGGLHTYRYSGSKVLYDGAVDLVSNVSGGVSYRVTWEYSATMSP